MELNPGGHLKFPRLWPGQIPPPIGQRDDEKLVGGAAFRRAGRCFLEAPALAFKFQEMAVMHEPIKQWRHDDDVAKQACPVFDGSV